MATLNDLWALYLANFSEQRGTIDDELLRLLVSSIADPGGPITIGDAWFRYLGALDYRGTLDDRLNSFLGDLGYTGTLPEKIYKALLDNSIIGFTADAGTINVIDLSRFGEVDVLDVLAPVGDFFVLFGDDSLDEFSFDPELAMYYPVATSFSTERIPVPPGTTKMAITPANNFTVVVVKPSTSTMEYGGDNMMLTWPSHLVADPYSLTLATPIVQTVVGTPNTGDDVTLIVKCRRDASMEDFRGTIAMLCPSIADGAPNIRISISETTNAIHAFGSNNAGTSFNVSDFPNVWPTDEHVMVAAVYNHLDLSLTLYRFAPSLADPTSNRPPFQMGSTTITNGLNVNPLSTLVVGSNNASVQNWGGDLDWVLVVRDVVTVNEFLRMWGPNAPPPPECLEDPTKVVAWVPIRANAPLKDYISNRLLTRVTNPDPGHMQINASTDETPPNTVNCILPQTVDNVANIGFNDEESTDVNPNSPPTGMMRAHTHYSLDADVGQAPDPDTAGFTTIPAGVSLVGCGQSELLSVENTSGTSTETGVLNLVALGHVRREGDMQWERLTPRIQATAETSQIDFEILQYGDEGTSAGWADPNNPDRRYICYLMNDHNTDGAAKLGIGRLNPVTGSWFDPSLGGQDIDGGLWDPIDVAIKAPHWAIADIPTKWCITGVITSDEGVGPAGVQAVVSVPTLDGDGVPTGWTNNVLGNVFADGFAGARNPLGIQNADAPEIYILAALTGGNIGYIGTTDEEWVEISNCPSSHPDVGFRWIKRTNYALTTDVEGPVEGSMRLTDVTTGVESVISTDADYIYLGGNDLDFDAQGWFAPEYPGQLCFLGQTAGRQALRFYTPVGPGEVASSYITQTLIPITDLDTGPPIGGPGYDFYFQSPEPIVFGGKSYMLVTVKETADPTDPVVAGSAQCQIWLLGMDGTKRRVDHGVVDGSVRARHESEHMISAPDEYGRTELLIYINEIDIGGATTNEIWVTRTGMFHTEAA